MSLLPWDQKTFTYLVDPIRETYAQCDTINVQYTNINNLDPPNPYSNPPPTLSYSITFYRGGYQPWSYSISNSNPLGTYAYSVNLPAGGPYMFTMRDSKDFTGGTSAWWLVSGTSGGCAIEDPMPPSSLSFTKDGYAQCGQVNYVVQNGTSPFRVELIPESHRSRTLNFATNRFGLSLDIRVGLNYFVVITDAAGNSAVDGPLTVLDSTDNSCLNVAPTLTTTAASTTFPGSGVVLPQSTSMLEGTRTSMVANPSGSSGDAPPPRSEAKRSNTPAIAGSISAAVAAIFLALVIIIIVRKRKKQTALGMEDTTSTEQKDSSAANQGPQQSYGRTSSSAAQYPSLAVPEIYSEDPLTHATAYPATSAAFTHQSNTRPHQPLDASPPRTSFSDVTTHAPVPQSQYAGQTTFFDRMQQPSSMSSGVANDTKGRVASPGLPPGAMSPAPTYVSTPDAGSTTFGPIQGGQRSDSSKNVGRPWVSSPPPRSDTGTALPPYNPYEIGPSTSLQ